MKTINLQHISPLIDSYDLYLFDIFGVLHDGEELISSTIEVINHLQEKNKNIFFLTNAPQRSSYVQNQLQRFGLPPSVNYGILTAGDQTFQYLRNRSTPCHMHLGKTCYFIGNHSMEDILPTPDYELTRDLESADFILAAGPDSGVRDIGHYKAILLNAAKLSLPMVCSNPDLFVFRKDKMEMRAGQIAAFYQNLGAKVLFHGKPHPETYKMMRQKFRNIPRERMLMIGDSVITDVAGANCAQIDSLLTVSFTTLKELGVKASQLDWKTFTSAVERMNNPIYIPTYFLPTLAW